MKRYKLIACKIMQRELSKVYINSPHNLDITFLRQDLPITYITWPGIDDTRGIAKAHEIAALNGWEYLEYEGSDSLLKKFVDGDWSEEDFLVLQPGEMLTPSYDERVICKQAD